MIPTSFTHNHLMDFKYYCLYISPHGHPVLPPSALPTTTPIGFGYYHLQPCPLPPHWFRILPPFALPTTTPIGFRYYHRQPYPIPPALASGFTTFSPTTRTNICFSQYFITVRFSCRSIVGQCVCLHSKSKPFHLQLN